MEVIEEALLVNGKNTAYYYFKGATPVNTTYTLKYDANGGTGAPSQQTGSSSTGSYTFTVKYDTPTKGDLHFMGWANSASATAAAYHGGSNITL